MNEALRALLAEPEVATALSLTARVAFLTLVLHLVAGLGLGYALAQTGWRGRTLLDLAVTLPLVFPPVATGFVLLAVFGRRSPLGAWLAQHVGIELIFSFWGVLLASFIAGLPLVVKPIQSALATVSGRLGEAARTLGKGEAEIFLCVLLPNIRRALAAGLILGLGRSLGEVGITLMLGGNISGRTATVSLEIFNAVNNGEFERAAVLSLLLGGLTVIAFLALRRLEAV
jgi:molybdate transport system permease protein